jgi:N-acetylglucosaminyl-diphospho-decaprenol L-rhamnosyltransferase
MRAPGIAVVTFNSASAVRRFLPGHAALAEAVDAPLVCVDNASADETAAVVGEITRGAAAIVRNSTNRGYAAAVNQAFAELGERDVLLLNPDVEAPSPEALERLGARLRDRPRAAVNAPRLIAEDGSAQGSARRFPSAMTMLASLPSAKRLAWLGRSYERYEEPSLSEAPVIVDWVVGAAMLIRRAAYGAVGGWDERFFLYMEDVDFCRRCARAGWEVWFDPGVRLRHGWARASTADGASVLRSRERRRHLVSYARYFAREPRLLAGRGRR